MGDARSSEHVIMHVQFNVGVTVWRFYRVKIIGVILFFEIIKMMNFIYEKTDF